jgi:hypothetical protein
MNESRTRKVLIGLYAALAVIVGLTAIATAQTSTTENIKGSPTVDTAKRTGVISYVEGNTLVVRMSTGELRTFTVPDSLKFVIDGKQETVHDLEPGTSLKATIVTTSTPFTRRTITNVSGKVFFVSGTTVILTLPDGTNKMYKSLPHFKFTINGRKGDLSDLRKGMNITAEKIEETPGTEVATNATVFGSTPKSKAVVAQVPAPVATSARK